MGYLKWLWNRISSLDKLFLAGIVYILALAYGLNYSLTLALVLAVALFLGIVGFLIFIAYTAFKASYAEYKIQRNNYK